MTRLRRFRLAGFAVLLSAISVQCGGEEKIGPQPRPSVIEMAGGNDQIGTVNDELSQPLVVKVLDEAGDPAEGVSVQWDAQGGGDVSPATTVTGLDGLAAVSRTLGETPGQQMTSASVTGLQGSPVTFIATATDGLTPTLAMATQPSPAAQTGVVLAVQPVVQLKDGAGADHAEGGVAVTAALTGSTGTLEGDVTRTTDASGATDFDDLAITGPDGAYTITFTAPGYVQVVSAAINLGTPSLAIKTQPSADAVSGTVLDRQPAVQLVDGSGANDAGSGIIVTATLVGGGATLDGDVTKATSATGVATFTDLVVTGDPGDYRLRFSAPGYGQITSSTVAVTAAPSTIALTTNPPTAALTGEVWDPEVQPEVQVKDGTGQPAPGVEVTASIAAGGGTLGGTATATTDATGLAKFGDLGIEGTGDQTLRFAIGTDTVTAAPVDLSPLTTAATKGRWGGVVDWDILPLHMHLLPTGKVLAWGKLEQNGQMGMPRLWDPAGAGGPSSAAMIAVDTMLFCSGHAFMPDGRLLISGGHKADGKGIDITTIFDPTTETFIQGLPKMAYGRWYPTVTELPDGRMLTMAGRDSAGNVVTTPEIWENNQWVELPGAGSLEIPYYPRNFVDPKNGLIFMAAERVRSRWFDVDGSTGTGRGRWVAGPQHLWPFNRDYGSAVMYETGRILVVGGGGDLNWSTPDAKSSMPTATAEKINLKAATPVWQNAGSMAMPRRHMNATILPDGEVLATGGTSGGGFDDFSAANAAREAEIWNPATNDWTTLAASSVVRTYHAVSLLLPDGTVLHGASGDALVNTTPKPDERSHEIFSPPYLFKGARPIISHAPTSVSYGETFAVATANAAQVTEVRWIHIGSVTHAFDAGQRANTLAFTRTATGVNVTAPGSANDATPGYYMLFILNRNGVPSKAKIVRLQ